MATLMLSRLPSSRQWSMSASHTAPMSQGRGGGGGAAEGSSSFGAGIGGRPFWSKSVTLLTTCGRTAGTEQRVEEAREWEGVGGVRTRGAGGGGAAGRGGRLLRRHHVPNAVARQDDELVGGGVSLEGPDLGEGRHGLPLRRLRLAPEAHGTVHGAMQYVVHGVVHGAMQYVVHGVVHDHAPHHAPHHAPNHMPRCMASRMPRCMTRTRC